jgi:mRNA interferase MazF
VKRGEIWAAAGGVYASKPRPVLIIQDDHFAGTDSVTVIPMTTAAVDAPLLRIPVVPTPATGLEQPSHIMIDKVTTTQRSSVQKRLGALAAADLVRVERSCSSSSAWEPDSRAH